MPTYTVTLLIDTFEATSPEDAANIALQMCDQEVNRTVYIVTDETTKKRWNIDPTALGANVYEIID